MRCFVALEIKDKIKNKLWEIGKHFKDGSTKLVEKSHYHVTLKFLGDIPKKQVNQIITNLSDIEVAPVSSNVKGLGVFPDMSYIKVIWAGLTGNFNPLVGKIDSITTQKRKKPFHPHVTLARVKRKPPKKTKKLIREYEDFEFGKQTLDTVVLKKSELTPEGPVYTTLKSVKL